jgi:hypothetical protein
MSTEFTRRRLFAGVAGNAIVSAAANAAQTGNRACAHPPARCASA